MIAVHGCGLHLRLGLGTLAVLAVTAVGLAPASGFAPWLATLGAMLVALALHETARVWTWRRLGVRVRGLEVGVFGARPVLADATMCPRAETLAGLAGLLVLAAPASGLLLAATWGGDDLAAIARWVGALAVLQAMPALPLDAGRIVRAWVWYLTDDVLSGTRAATTAAHVIASGLVGLGAVLFLLDPSGTLPYWGVWLVTAGWQVGAAARAENRHARWQRDGRTVTLGAAVAARSRAIAAATPLADALEALHAVGSGGVLLVTDDERPLGILRENDLRRARRGDWERRTVDEAMMPLAGLTRLDADLTIVDAVALLIDGGHAVGLVQRGGTTFAAVATAHLAGPLPEREDVEEPPPEAAVRVDPTR